MEKVQRPLDMKSWNNSDGERLNILLFQWQADP